MVIQLLVCLFYRKEDLMKKLEIVIKFAGKIVVYILAYIK